MRKELFRHERLELKTSIPSYERNASGQTKGTPCVSVVVEVEQFDSDKKAVSEHIEAMLKEIVEYYSGS